MARQPLFYPAWEILPHEDKLPHADVISDRLQTLVALSQPESEISKFQSKIIVASVTALLQKTFPPGEIQSRIRVLERGSKIAPLELIEFLEEQGYEPEAQVSQKGEITLRGGILDVFPPTSPWPVRLEFFGDELESLRYFDPFTQISREEIVSIALPPAGELGIFKQSAGRIPRTPDSENRARGIRPSKIIALATLLDYLPREAIFLFCEPEQLAACADEYESQVPADDPFLISWPDFLTELNRHGFASVQLAGDTGAGEGNPQSAIRNPQFDSLDAFRPLAERAPEPQIAEAQRREFFQQLHRWLRQDYCRPRFLQQRRRTPAV